MSKDMGAIELLYIYILFNNLKKIQVIILKYYKQNYQ